MLARVLVQLLQELGSSGEDYIRRSEAMPDQGYGKECQFSLTDRATDYLVAWLSFVLNFNIRIYLELVILYFEFPHHTQCDEAGLEY